MSAAYTLGIHVDFPTAVILCVLSTLSATGASGVAGGSLLFEHPTLIDRISTTANIMTKIFFISSPFRFKLISLSY
jgi:Na+/serine symporter